MSNGLATSFMNLLQQHLAKPGPSQMAPSLPSGTAPQSKPFADPLIPFRIDSGSSAVSDKEMKDIFRTVFRHEGSAYVGRDGVEASKFGILQGTANRLGYKGDVRNMSRREAEAIYRKLWAKSGAAELPRNLALVHFDTYVNSPAAAKKMLKSCGQSTEAYLDLRSQRYARLCNKRPERFARYMKGWMNRIHSLRTAASPDSTSISAKALA
jgi:lysozyme family protein